MDGSTPAHEDQVSRSEQKKKSARPKGAKPGKRPVDQPKKEGKSPKEVKKEIDKKLKEIEKAKKELEEKKRAARGPITPPDQPSNEYT